MSTDFEGQKSGDGQDKNGESTVTTNVCQGVPNAGDFTGAERVLLMSNASLQRQISAYYCAPVLVDIRENHAIKAADARFSERGEENASWSYRRCVLLQVGPSALSKKPIDPTLTPTTFGIALSVMTFTSREYHDFYVTKRPGIGQLYAHLGLLPRFRLLRMGRDFDWTAAAVREFYHDDDAQQRQSLDGRKDSSDNCVYEWYADCRQLCAGDWHGSNIWREYELVADGLCSRILEVLRADISDIPQQ